MTCDHYALKMPQQPCPHPDCWKKGEVLEIAEPRPVSYVGMLPADATFHVKRFKRERLRVPDMSDIYAWRPA